MYRATPLTYFINGLLVACLKDAKVECSPVEILRIEPLLTSTVRTCGEYMAPYLEAAGGYLVNPEAKENCGLCPVGSTNDVMAAMGLDINMSSAWKDVGCLTVYVVFNVLAIFGVYWLVRVRK